MFNKKQFIKFDKNDMKLLAIIALLIVFMSIVFSLILLPVYAEEYTEIDIKNFDSTNILDDLNSAENFDITQYPIDKKMDTFIVQNVVEYCYSFDENKRSNYAVYIYLYNPSLIEIDTTSYDNKVQLAVGYDSEGNPNDYEKFSLKFCSVANDSNYKRLFYKFKIVDKRSASDNKTIAERVNSNARRYDISGIELFAIDSVLAKEYPVNKTYTYSGYAAGYGPDETAESTLQCYAEKLTTLKLNVEHTFYRTLTSNKGADFQNQIDTVYFSVPNEYFDNYGKLQRIKAEWFEYKTKPIVVTSNEDFYNKSQEYIAKNIGSDYKTDIGYTISTSMFTFTWNRFYLIKPDDISNTTICPILYYMFLCDNIEKYDPYVDYSDNGVTSNDLYNYILDYNKTYSDGKLPIKNGFISADLFESDIDDIRKVNNEFGKIQNGYCVYDFDSDLDLKNLGTWQQTNPTFIDNINKWGFWDTLFGNIPKEDAIKELSPIVTFDYSDLTMSAEELVNKYYININDVSKFKSYASRARMNDEKVILFRFATSDYYCAELFLQKGLNGTQKTGQAYLAQESVFLNFDIIQLTFLNKDKYTVIPVVSSPIDIVDGITPPTSIKNDNKNIFTIVLTALILFFAFIILVKVIIWLFKVLVNSPAKTNTKGKFNKKEYRQKGKKE